MASPPERSSNLTCHSGSSDQDPQIEEGISDEQGAPGQEGAGGEEDEVIQDNGNVQERIPQSGRERRASRRAHRARRGRREPWRTDRTLAWMRVPRGNRSVRNNRAARRNEGDGGAYPVYFIDCGRGRLRGPIPNDMIPCPVCDQELIMEDETEENCTNCIQNNIEILQDWYDGGWDNQW